MSGAPTGLNLILDLYVRFISEMPYKSFKFSQTWIQRFVGTRLIFTNQARAPQVDPGDRGARFLHQFVGHPFGPVPRLDPH